MIYQMHDEHGKHIAYNNTEAEANIKNGWKTVSEEEFYGIEPKKDLEGYAELVEAYTRKFGKKPHHKMKPETISEKLNADSE